MGSLLHQSEYDTDFFKETEKYYIGKIKVFLDRITAMIYTENGGHNLPYPEKQSQKYSEFCLIFWDNKVSLCFASIDNNRWLVVKYMMLCGTNGIYL